MPARGDGASVARPAEAGTLCRSRMTRVLLLSDAEAGFAVNEAVRQIAVSPAGDVVVERVRIGRGGEISPDPRGLRRLRDRAGECDVVHALGVRALLAAALATARPIAASPGAFPSRRAARLLRALHAARPFDLVCDSWTMRRAAARAGFAPQRAHLIRPGVDFAAVRRRRDTALRERLGIAPDDYVLLAPGETDRPSGHEQAAWAGAVVHLLDARYRLLTWGRGPRADALRRRVSRLDLNAMHIDAARLVGGDVTHEALLGEADAALVCGDDAASPLPLAQAMAGGLPIVAVASSTACEMVEDRHTALLVPRFSARDVARRVLDLRQDVGLQWRLCDLARVEAYEYFSAGRFVEQWRQVYRQLHAGVPVEVPPPPPGAGLRFHGRA